MDTNFAKQVIIKLKDNKILDYDFWISKDLYGDCIDVDVDDIADSVERLIDNNNGHIRSGNYCVLYNEGCVDDEGDKVFIFKDYIELTIPKRNKGLN